jgi:hypothetical protein
LDGGGLVVLASGQLAPYGIAVDADNVYWTDEGVNYASNGSVQRIGLCGGAPTVLAANQEPYAIAIDSRNVYWTNWVLGSGSTGTIESVPIEGGPTTQYAGGQYQPSGIAVRPGVI